MDPNDNPTPPAEGASGAQSEEQGGKTGEKSGDGGARPSVPDLLAAARGEAVKREPPARAERTPVTPAARLASSGTVAEAAPKGDAPGKSVPSATPTAARVSPASGASAAASTPTPSVNAGVAKAVAAKPPAKPPAAGPLVQSLPDPSVNQLRRWIVWGSVAGFFGALSLMMARFFLPRAIFEPSSIFRIGFPGDYALGVDTKWQQQYRIWVVKNSERLFVIYARCTHLGCTPDWKASENKFKCPCHGSGYDSEGVNFEGPAPRPMDRAEVKMDAEGQVVVNV
ncbi:MAG TPA: Rieske 2Fe-2S domain-containing protein, partial [Pyrinomonadaceae bacterium]|nr:Rieske 2Fe-2S domain-containing protein [Pyrinomonadaceae bacterium]